MINKKEVIYNLINSGLAGALVLVGAFSNGAITWTGFIAAAAAAGIVFITKFKSYWEKEVNSYKTKLLTFY